MDALWSCRLRASKSESCEFGESRCGGEADNTKIGTSSRKVAVQYETVGATRACKSV